MNPLRRDAAVAIALLAIALGCETIEGLMPSAARPATPRCPRLEASSNPGLLDCSAGLCARCFELQLDGRSNVRLDLFAPTGQRSRLVLRDAEGNTLLERSADRSKLGLLDTALDTGTYEIELRGPQGVARFEFDLHATIGTARYPTARRSTGQRSSALANT